MFYEGREKSFQFEEANQAEFIKWIDLLYDHLYYEWSSSGPYYVDVTGGYELWRNWFPNSQLYHSSAIGLPSSTKATNELLDYLKGAGYIEAPIDSTQQHEVLDKIHSLIQKYGAKELGFGSKLPAALGPALKRFCLTLEPTPSNSNRDKVIHHASYSQD